MKQKLQIALFVGAILSGGLNAPLLAATAKSTESAGKKAVAPAVKNSQVAKKPVSKTAGKKAPIKSVKINTGKAGKPILAAVDSPRKAMRRVTFADVDQGRLSLHSASVLVIDQNTGQTLFEKHS
ncbi:MAG TPA: peptidase, partial [Azonexus sp.]|nr:peptidase [Azonexus sp.]